MERGSTGSHSVANSLWSRVWTCRKTDYVMTIIVIVGGLYMYQDFIFMNSEFSAQLILRTVELHLSGRLLSGSPIIRFGIDLRVKICR
jgi:hypothetical protein